MMDKYRSRPPRGRSRSRSEERRGRGESEREGKGGEGAQYGLIGGRAEKGVAGNIGPPVDLVTAIYKRKREEMSKRQTKGRAHATAPLMEEEKQRRLSDMMSAADQLEGQRDMRVLGAARSADQEHKSTQGSGATFLGDMQKRAYASANSMQDRLRENQHYSQRGGDLQGTGFTKPG